MKYKGIIFDFNGVLLWDSHLQEEAWNKMSWELRSRSFTQEEMLTYMHGRINKDTLEYLSGKQLTPDETEELSNKKEQYYRELCLQNKNEFHLSPGAQILLNNLMQHNIPHTIATSSPKVNVDFFIESLHLHNWFDTQKIIYDDGTLPGKPAPDIYLRAANILKLLPSECVIVEDAQSGITAANNAGIGKIIALGPKEKQETLSKLNGVSEVITQLNEIDITLLFL